MCSAKTLDATVAGTLVALHPMARVTKVSSDVRVFFLLGGGFLDVSKARSVLKRLVTACQSTRRNIYSDAGDWPSLYLDVYT